MTVAALIGGKAAALQLRSKLAALIPALSAQLGRPPGLAVVLVGDNPASAVYVASKAKQTVEVGMRSFEHRHDASMSQEALLALIAQLNADPNVDGILVQLPLPKHIDEAVVLNVVSPDKDVDGFHIINAGRLATGQGAMVPCTPLGCLMLLKQTLGTLSALHAVVVGRSNIVGKPMAQLLLAEDCTVTIAHSRTSDLADVVRRADILVVAVGKANMIKGSWLKPGCTVIDVGINRVNGKLVGDVEFSSAVNVAAHITPVPGGVGPMTIACLLRNTVVAACVRQGLPVPKI
jgi:methylenetetrahydrofolate dehydrogenase (NADP+) / methenyltetrahydrofolate cyclohydrolase